MALTSISSALQELDSRPLLRLFLHCFAKRVREQVKFSAFGQPWKEKILCAFAHAILDMDKALIDGESSEADEESSDFS